VSTPAIQVENLAKLYRLGRRDEGSRTLVEAVGRMALAPWRNFRQLRNLTHFDDAATNAANDILWALRDVSFAVAPGEVVGIIGHNGAGKSTLLKILSRITLPTQGRVVVHGRLASLLEVGTGFHPELSGRDNIYLNGAILGMTRREIQQRFDAIVAFAEIEKFLDTPVKRYSSGMYVRLAFAVAAHLEPEILVVDEVLAVGDTQFQRKCLGKMNEVSRQDGRTVLFVSHNLGAVTQLCTRAILFERGRIVQDGPAEQVVAKYLAQGGDARVTFKDAPSRAPAQLLSVRLLDHHGAESVNLDMRFPFTVEVEYNIAAPLTTLDLALRLHRADGTAVLTTLPAHTDAEAVQRVAQGRWRGRVTLPGMLLYPGDYYWSAALHEDRGPLYDERRYCLQFNVAATNAAHTRYGDFTSQGAVALALPWTVEKL